MTIYELVQLVNATQKKPLSPLQEWVLHQAWEGKTYSRMAAEGNYVEEYLRKTASELWSLLSKFWGESITKYNFRATFEPCQLSRAQQQLIRDYSYSTTITPIEFPGGPLSLDSKFYIPRPPIEELAYEEITKPGSVIRIKAPRKLGKSSLMLRIIAHATALNYRVVTIDFKQADRAVYANLDKFLRWFCANLSRELNLESKLDDYWDEEIGSKVSCSIYFQAYLLEKIQTPLILALNEVNLLFEYPEIAQDFLPLLRFWHEQAKILNIWQKLRLVVAYSTEVYVPLKLNQSPFNVGLPLKLAPFTIDQVQELALRYGLDWTDNLKVKKLMAIVGGHPYLVQLYLYHFQRQEVTLKQLMQQSTIDGGIYEEHLRDILGVLLANPELEAALKQVISSDDPLELEPIIADKLDSMGLVSLEGEKVILSCELYRLYFRKRLLQAEELSFVGATIRESANYNLVQLERENRELRRLSSIDDFTQLANRRYFGQYLEEQWQRLVVEKSPLSVIFCDVDFFKIYNKTWGYEAGDRCLQKMADVLQQVVRQSYDLVAYYQDDQFGVILPSARIDIALEVADRIRDKIKELSLAHNPKICGLPAPVLTVSLGVATTIPCLDDTAETLLRAANEALYQAKLDGRDRVSGKLI